MNNNLPNVDVNVMPVHLFVKSPKQAKKIGKYTYMTYRDPEIDRKNRRFQPVSFN